MISSKLQSFDFGLSPDDCSSTEEEEKTLNKLLCKEKQFKAISKSTPNIHSSPKEEIEGGYFAMLPVLNFFTVSYTVV